MDHPFYMRLALETAWRFQLLTYPNPAVGAVVLDKHGALLAVSAHERAGGPHAEVRAIRDAYARLSGDESLNGCEEALRLHEALRQKAGRLFEGATIYVTLEPCAHTGRTPPCAGLIEALGFKRAVIGTRDPNPQAAGGIERLKACGIEVIEGVEKEACERLLEPFVRWRAGRFVLFKLAQRLNGTVDGGTISSEASRRWVHRLRGVADRLVIGARTVRTDRPLLDCRLSGDRPPNVTILSRRQETVDRSIPLFFVPGREVEIADQLPEKGLILVEGGPALLKSLEETYDWLLLFIAPRLKEGLGYNGTQELIKLHQSALGEDITVWLKAKHG